MHEGSVPNLPPAQPVPNPGICEEILHTEPARVGTEEKLPNPAPKSTFTPTSQGCLHLFNFTLDLFNIILDKSALNQAQDIIP